MTSRGLIAHGAPQRLPTRAAASTRGGQSAARGVPSMDSVDDPQPT